ncbi:MAG: hypothetical protein J7J98_05000 [candidate division Zixibacteria bacterium]|nr:hypothetical protein [candidate division Zixibacteria bacterium]
MNRFLMAGSVSMGSWGGWWLGSQVNIWLALVLGAVGGGLGLYLYRRYLSEMLE